MRELKIGLVLVLAIAAAGCGGGGTTEPSPAAPPVHPDAWPAITSAVAQDPELEQKVTDLLAAMSLEEKVGQVIQSEIRHTTPEDVKEYHLGSVLNGGGSHPGNDKHSTIEDWVALADAYWEASMDTSDGGQAIPIIWGSDAVHGHNNVIGATLFPHNVGLGCTRNPELLRRIGEATATEVAVTGLDWTFGPTLAVAQDDRWGRTYESYSEEPEVVHSYAGMMVEGYQGVAGGDDWLDENHVISTAKHFLADGGTDQGKDQGDCLASEEELVNVHAAGYTSALAAGVQTVMASFSSWQGVKMHGNKELLTDVLKGRMGFDGFVVGDWNAHGQVPGCTNESCAAAFVAGVDMFMVPEDWKALYKNTLEQVKSGEITMERLDDAVRRILRVKMRTGLFERGKPSSRALAGKKELIGAPEHRAVARQAVRESLVLLKNNGGLLPLAPRQRVLVAGDGADDLGKQTGGWTITWQGSGNVRSDFPGATSIWDGVREVVEGAGGTAVLSEDGSYDAKPDAALVVFGEDPYAEFQGDVESIDYAGAGLEALRALKEAGVPTVAVFLSGRPLWVNPELNASDAFVAAWLPGTEGSGVADVLFRAADGSVRHDFLGKLSFSWPRSLTQVVLNHGDADYDPLFAYGYGLTYADEGDLGELSEDMGGLVAVSSKVYFEGGPVAPWQLWVADEAGAVEATGARTTTAGSENLVLTAVDKDVQEDARQAVWSGGAEARVYLHAETPVDISRESNGDLSLGFAVRVDQAPTGAVKMKIGAGELDVTQVLADLPAGEWQELRLFLRCFEDHGTDMSKVDTPFEIATGGALSLAFADVRLVTLAEGEAICP